MKKIKYIFSLIILMSLSAAYADGSLVCPEQPTCKQGDACKNWPILSSVDGKKVDDYFFKSAVADPYSFTSVCIYSPAYPDAGHENITRTGTYIKPLATSDTEWKVTKAKAVCNTATHSPYACPFQRQ